MDPSSDLPDSTDWIATSLPSFEPLEAALRCEVCKEFYENPVITSCSHTFCSLCIRRCISSDAKCPTCKNAVQADKLLPNFAVREIVSRFQEARPKALELARRDKEDSDANSLGKKRKLEDTDIEEDEPVRQTRSRMSCSRSQRGNGNVDAPISVPDSEDDGDADFVPVGMVKCPICSKPMKEELVWSHVGDCTGEIPRGGRSMRSKQVALTKQSHAFTNSILRRTSLAPPNSLQQRAPPPAEVSAPNRLPGLNYALLKESALKKKLQDLGIPATGKKELLARRHTEWLHLWNSNCDASETKRKSKRELLRELDVWERTQGGSANTAEARIMRKDFDGAGHANTHKSQFDDLIANARKKRATPNGAEKKEETIGEEEIMADIRPSDAAVDSVEPDTVTEQRSSINQAKPYEGNEGALATIRAKVAETNQSGHIVAPPRDSSSVTPELPPGTKSPRGIHPFGSSADKQPMFSLPEHPVVDVEGTTFE